ncbi:MAG TPA: hypothetical protein VGO04_01700 [Ensifer sp.]|jgi:hypothetical protein|nr:hypothetical protein [Ensifer sp.]
MVRAPASIAIRLVEHHLELARADQARFCRQVDDLGDNSAFAGNHRIAVAPLADDLVDRCLGTAAATALMTAFSSRAR